MVIEYVMHPPCLSITIGLMPRVLVRLLEKQVAGSTRHSIMLNYTNNARLTFETVVEIWRALTAGLSRPS